MNRKWLVKRTNPEYVKYVSKTASISPALAQILINRGLKTQQAINDFLKPRLSDFSDPFALAGVNTAIERIRHAVSRNEKILVHGDYDADGVTATAIMVHALRTLGLDVHYFIPNRITHGYGFNPAAVKVAKKLGAGLIITVDCGITSFEAASLAKKEGIDVIITDHHEPIVRMQDKKEHVSCIVHHESFVLPEAVVVINPKLMPNASGFTDLSGAGLAFKIAQALEQIGVKVSRGQGKTPRILEPSNPSFLLLDLAALGTVADVVPLTGENRIIVKEGIKLIRAGQRPGISALKSAAGLNGREIKSGLLSFTLIPRINAAGRIADAGDVVRLLLSDAEGESSDLSLWLDGLNSKRQRIEEDVYQEALAKLNAEGFDSVIVLAGDGWHQGVVGIVASRIAEEFNRPAFVLSVEDGVAKGSARSVPSFNICAGLAECKELLLSFGGHKQAAGVRLKAENIPAFRTSMQEIIKNSPDFTGDGSIPLLEIDADITLSEINHNLIKELQMLEPLGNGNEEPFFGSKGLEVINPRIVGNNHLKMRLKQGGQSLDVIGFDMAASGDSLRRGAPDIPAVIDAVFTPALNEWNNRTCLQLNLKAFRPSK